MFISEKRLLSVSPSVRDNTNYAPYMVLLPLNHFAISNSATLFSLLDLSESSTQHFVDNISDDPTSIFVPCLHVINA